jgi:hypothetical protein
MTRNFHKKESGFKRNRRSHQWVGANGGAGDTDQRVCHKHNNRAQALLVSRATEGRDLQNEGRVEDGKAPKITKPGTGH